MYRQFRNPRQQLAVVLDPIIDAFVDAKKIEA